jgi:hypothetical protein
MMYPNHGSARSSAGGRGTAALLRAVAVSLIGLALAVGCSDQPVAPPAASPAPPAPPAPTTYSPELCTAATQFQTAANALAQLDGTKVGTDGVKAALQDLADAGRNLAVEARAQFAPPVAALEQALPVLQTTIAQIGDQTNLSARLGAITTSVAQVEVAAAPIVESVRTGCTGVPPVVIAPTS